MKILFTFSLLIILTCSARAAFYIVTRSDDRNATCNPGVDCSLREAVKAAQATAADDFIVFNVPSKIITLTSEIVYQNSPDPGMLTITGPGANAFTINAGSGTNRIFWLHGVNTTITGLTLTGGNGTGATQPGFGGAVFIDGVATTIFEGVLFVGNTTTFALTPGGAIATGGGIVHIRDSTFSANSAPSGGGGAVYTNGTTTMIITNSTFTGNSSGQQGGAIFSGSAQSAITLRNVTVVNNRSASSAGGGIGRGDGGFEVGNSIVAQNYGFFSDDLTGTFISLGNNLIGDGAGSTSFVNGVNGDEVGITALPIDPRVGGLQNNGGAIPTRALRPGSTAINSGNNSLATTLTNDERGTGFPRINGGTVDKGAYEFLGGFTTDRVIDFDGDSKTDISIFRPTPGEWWYYRSSDGGNYATAFGTSTDKLVPGDYTGDNRTDIAFWRPSTGEWFILRSGNQTFFSFPFGASGDLPAPADYDGDGQFDAAAFRPSTATWYILRSSDNGTTIEQFGANGDTPVPGDYDSDGKADLAIFRPSLGQWWWRRSLDGIVPATTFGTSTDKPVQGDYTGDGKADQAFFRPSTNEWFVLRSEDFSYYSAPFGAAGDLASPGDYDGDGKYDLAIFRPSNSTWYVTKTTGGTLIQTFGASGDRPVPNTYVP